MKKIIFSKFFSVFLKLFFSLFYNRKYLTGYYFETKRQGWLWAYKGLIGKMVGQNTKIPWPVNPSTIISNSRNIIFDINDLHLFQTPGCYWQNIKGKIIVGKGCYVAQNVGLITTNHNLYNLSKHTEGKDIILGRECWIGMNSIILPGVSLGDHTIVAAGSVVTKSFTQGYCVIGGNPAKIIKELNIEEFSKEKNYE